MASTGLYAIIRGLAAKAAKETAKSAQRDAGETVPKVFRPTDDLSLDPTLNVSKEAPTSFGPTPSQLDRDPLVLEEFQRMFPESFGRSATTRRGSSGTIEQQLDEIERRLIDEGKLSDIGTEPSARKPSEYEPTKSDRPEKPDARADEEAIKKELGFIPKEKYTKAQEGKPQDLRASKEIPRQDDIDLTNARQEAILQRRIKQLQEQPEIDTPANEEILARQVIGEDALDKASGKFFGRGLKYKVPEGDDFTLRDLEDIFVRGKDVEGKPSSRIINPNTPEEQLIGNTPQAKAVLALKARGTAASQGRSTGPGDARRIPTGKRSFERERPITGEELDETQEALTGRLRPDVALEQAQIKANAQALQADLRAIRTRTNELTPRQESLRDLITSGEKPTKEAVQAIYEEFPVDKAKFPLTPDPGRQIPAPRAEVRSRGGVSAGRKVSFIDDEGNVVEDVIDEGAILPDENVSGRTPQELSKARRIIGEQGGTTTIRQPEPQGRPVLPFDPSGPRSATPGVPYKLSDEEVLRNVLIEILNTRGR
jgi:hypothetical protein